MTEHLSGTSGEKIKRGRIKDKIFPRLPDAFLLILITIILHSCSLFDISGKGLEPFYPNTRNFYSFVTFSSQKSVMCQAMSVECTEATLLPFL